MITVNSLKSNRSTFLLSNKLSIELLVTEANNNSVIGTDLSGVLHEIAVEHIVAVMFDHHPIYDASKPGSKTRAKYKIVKGKSSAHVSPSAPGVLNDF